MRSNVSNWKALQEDDYFEKHPCYKGLVDMGDAECGVIEWFTPLRDTMNVVVIGCGYGRESAHIAKRVKHVYGIDVSERILEKARRYLAEKSVFNFTGVTADDYKTRIPDGIDLVFSIVVMQHLTRDLAQDYLTTLGRKLTPQGKMVIQFVEDFMTGLDADAELKEYEPSVSWNIRQIVEAADRAGLRLNQARSYMSTPSAIWHWACLERKDASSP